MAGPGNILIRVGAETADAIRGLSSVNKSLGDTMTTSEKMSAGIKKAALPAAAALGLIGVAALDSAKAAMEDATAHDHLVGVIERTTGATETAASALDDWITKTELATGVSDDKLRPAFEKLITATGDAQKAQTLMNQSLDIAAATGKDVETVSAAVAKGYQGSTASLAKLVPGLDAGVKSSKDFTLIMGEMARVTGGAAAESADTAAGQMARFQVATQEAKESVGAALLPAIQALLPVLVSMAQWAQQNSKVIEVLAGVVAVLAGGIIAANIALKAYAAAQVIVQAATKAWAAAQWLLNAALDANPIGLVVVAIAALGAALVVAYTKSETFRNVVQAALGAVKVAINAVADAFTALMGAARAAFDWIVAHWQLALFAFGPIGIAISLIASNFDKIKAAGEAAFNAITAAIDALLSAIRSVVDAVETLIGALGRIHVPHISIPNPLGLSSPFGVTTMAASGRSSRSSSSAPVVVNIYGALDPEETARAIRRVLGAHDRRLGWAPY